MASPPTLTISNPQSSNTAAARSESFRSFFRHGSFQLRPWVQLIDHNSLFLPATLSEAHMRVIINHYHFMANYVTVICITIAYSLSTYPLYSLIFVLLSFLTFTCLSRNSPHQNVVLFGCTFSETKILIALAFATVFLTDFISLLTSGLMAGLAIVLTHAAFRVPHQDFFLLEQEPGFPTNFNPLVSDNPSSSPPPVTKHGVFLSIRGEDSCNSFTSHLYEELRSKNIETFMDDKLGTSRLNWSKVQKAIEESTIYVIIFSEHYASSKRCLDELTKIVECSEKYGRIVIPVFYNVDPTTVWNQKESYEVDLVKHEKQQYKEEVPGWKRALTKVAALRGWYLYKIRSESELVTKIVEDILRRLNNSPSSYYKGLIGIPKHITQIQSLLHLESAVVRVIGIWGIGGIGKTTIAGALYHLLATQFSFHSFVVNFEEDIKRYGGIDSMPSKYLKELLGEKPGDRRGSSLEQKLNQGKVLLILDNVNSSAQLEELISVLGDSFCPGSRIIVISRDKKVLKKAAADGIYEVKESRQ